MNDYNNRLVLALARGLIPRGVLTNVQIRHDSWCSVLQRQAVCTCNPDVVLDTPEGEVRILDDGSTA